jgi:hypothetical protein
LAKAEIRGMKVRRILMKQIAQVCRLRSPVRNCEQH